MTPRDVDELSRAEYLAFWEYRESQIRAEQRAAREARRKRR